MRLFFIALALIGALAVTGPATAHDLETPRQSPEELIEQATRDMMRIFKMLLQSIPQYEAPEILENGDIIIRRVHPKPRHPERNDDEDKAKI